MRPHHELQAVHRQWKELAGEHAVLARPIAITGKGALLIIAPNRAVATDLNRKSKNILATLQAITKASPVTSLRVLVADESTTLLANLLGDALDHIQQLDEELGELKNSSL